MTIIESEQVLGCDIDQTLLMWGVDYVGHKTVSFYDPYEKAYKVVVIHQANIKVLVDRLERGATFLVWSASGFAWAKEALKALGIRHHNIIVLSKPIGYLDDKKCSDWMGEQIFLPLDSKWGQGL